MLDRIFALKANGTTVRREMVAGCTTFAAMAYILAVNPQILSVAGMDPGAVLTATALASALMTVAMGGLTNYPIALAPGMGLNAFFAFTICGVMQVPWPAALGFVFYGGVVFLVLSATGLRRRLIEAIPFEMKLAITCGIGLFILFIGLKNGGVIVSHPATFVAMGKISDPSVLLVLGGIVLTAVLVGRKVRGAIVLSVLLITVVGLFVPAADGAHRITKPPERFVALPGSLAPTFLKFDLGYLWQHPGQSVPIVLALLFVELFDNMGTLIGVCHRAGLLDASGNLPRIGRALMADATAAMVGSSLGTSTVTSYIESAAGVEEGGRTGLTSAVVALCFLLALFFNPILQIIPAAATAPALAVVGVFMMQGITELDLKDFAKAMPAVMTMVTMPLTFSISEGLAVGFVVHAGLMLGLGRGREVSAVAYGLAALSLAHLLFR